MRPRWMERLIEIERGTKREQRRLAEAHEALREECGEDRRVRPPLARGRGSLAVRRAQRADPHHNEWYPVERDLPMDLRTRDYVLINGRSYRRPELGPEWVLEQFPARQPRYPSIVGSKPSGSAPANVNCVVVGRVVVSAGG